MPSSRQIRVVLTITVIAVLALLFFHGSERSSDKAYYEKTVAAIDARLKAQYPGAENHHNIPPPAPNAKEPAHRPVPAADAADEEDDVKRKPPAVALGTGSDGQKIVKDSKGYATGDDEEDGLGKTGKKEDDGKTEKEREVEAELNSILKRSPIIIFSKSYCPHSKKAKHIFSLYSLTPAPFIVELDEHPMGSDLQDSLQKLTGRRTVPNILISGHTIGGGDEVGALHEGGDLIGKIKEMGGKRIMEARLKGIKEKA